ncbi:hypothetical protein [Pleomorphovibrio marinus]|uniref:hypothetical protein n=1 Tax=Pleomorphovibrio marinus TaxID=2164132 RepID=UPI00130063F7|nr:hypothetical protein [Pleomorphovibrio marinus]
MKRTSTSIVVTGWTFKRLCERDRTVAFGCFQWLQAGSADCHFTLWTNLPDYAKTGRTLGLLYRCTPKG